MAKTTKGGLGRGLNSLIGGMNEGNTPAFSSSDKERVSVDATDVDRKEKKKPKEEQKSSVQQTDEKTKEGEEPTQKKNSSAQLKNKDTASENSLKSESHHIDEVSIDKISPNPNQPRTNFNKEEIEELAESIEKSGLLQPIVVRELEDGRYQIIAGERRWQACKLAGLKKVPIRIQEIDEDKALELALIENVQRSDLNPIEEAYGYKRLMERNRMTQSDVAQAVAKGRSTIANSLRLLDLPEAAQKMLFEDKITAGHARAILSVPSQEGRLKLTGKLMEKKMSVRETEALAQLLSGKSKQQSNARATVPSSYKTVAKALRDVLKTNVKVKSSQGKNKIEIEFKDEDDLERLFKDLIASS